MAPTNNNSDNSDKDSTPKSKPKCIISIICYYALLLPYLLDLWFSVVYSQKAVGLLTYFLFSAGVYGFSIY